MSRSFTIDCFPECAGRYRGKYTIVAIDVIRATTTAITALDLGHRVFPAASLKEALELSQRIPQALLVGEQHGSMPDGFDFTNSPYQLTCHFIEPRPIILVSSSGTRLMIYATGSTPVYAGCFRNLSALARHLISNHKRVALLGAGSKRDFRHEDQMGCAFIANKLIAAGFIAENERTIEIVNHWGKVDYRQVAYGKSADYLRQSNQLHDLEFILAHYDDLDIIPILTRVELSMDNKSNPLWMEMCQWHATERLRVA